MNGFTRRLEQLEALAEGSWRRAVAEDAEVDDILGRLLAERARLLAAGVPEPERLEAAVRAVAAEIGLGAGVTEEVLAEMRAVGEWRG